jgi:hypothetical protein
MGLVFNLKPKIQGSATVRRNGKVVTQKPAVTPKNDDKDEENAHDQEGEDD